MGMPRGSGPRRPPASLPPTSVGFRFVIDDGSRSPEMFDLLVQQPELDHLTLDSQVTHGSNSWSKKNPKLPEGSKVPYPRNMVVKYIEEVESKKQKTKGPEDRERGRGMAKSKKQKAKGRRTERKATAWQKAKSQGAGGPKGRPRHGKK